MAKKITLVDGVSKIVIPEDVRVIGVLLGDVRQPYRLTPTRNLQTREPLNGVVDVLFEKIALTTRVEVAVAAAWPLTPTP